MDRLASMETFIRVVETGSFSGAARQLRVGQPAVSKTVAQLETYLGVKLLTRSTRGLTPTEAGLGYLRKNDTHASTSDPNSRLYRKAAGREAKLCYMGHATMENRHGLAVAGMVTHANGTAERRAAEIMLKARSKAAGHRITAGEDKAYDTADHVANLRAINVTPHVTQNNGVTKTGKTRNSAIDNRTTRYRGYAISQSRRAMIECIFGWGKQHGTMRKTK